MTAAQTLDYYDKQANAAAGVEWALARMTDNLRAMTTALGRAVDRMGELLSGTKNVEAAAAGMKTPFDTMAETVGTGLQQGLSKVSETFTPQGLMLSLGVNLVWQLFGDDLMTVLQPAMRALESFAGLVSSTVYALGPLFRPVVWALDMLGRGMDVLGQNAALLLIPLAALAFKLGVFQRTAWGIKAASMASAAFQFAMGALNMVMGFFSGNTALAALGIQKMNAAMAMNPAAAMITAILILVGALAAAVAAYNHLTGASISAVGVIGGTFAVLGAFVLNLLTVVWNAFAAVANFLGNVFSDPVAAIKVLFCDMALTVLGFILKIAEGIEGLINRIPGMQVDITGGLRGVYDKVDAASRKVKSESAWTEYVKRREFTDYGDAANAGYQKGEELWNRVSTAADIAPEVSEIADNTGALADEVNIADEDLQFLRDAAEMRYIQNFVTLTPTVAMNASISGQVDVEGVVSAIERKLEEEFAASAEGVYI